MKKTFSFNKHWSLYIFGLFAVTVVLLYALIDINILGRLMFSSKDKYENYADAKEQIKKETGPPYINLTASVLVAQEEKTRIVSTTKNNDQCKDSCTFDDACIGYVFNGLSNECKLLYDIAGYERNVNGLYTTKSGIKLRDYIGVKDPDRKFLRHEGMEFPPDGQGKISTHQFIDDVETCKTKCLDNQESLKCVAFEYDFKNKGCTLNSEIRGKLGSKEQKDVYVLIN